MKQGLLVAAGFAAALALSPVQADAASIAVSDGPFTISVPGTQSYGIGAFLGNLGDDFTADFRFNIGSAALTGGSTAIECTGGCANVAFDSIELYGDNPVSGPLTSGSTGLLIGNIDYGVISAFPQIAVGEYLVRITGRFLADGPTSLGGTVSLVAVPVPAALPLMLGALAGLGLIARRKTDA